MTTYLIICGWLLIGALSFFVIEYYEPSTTRGDYLTSLFIYTILGIYSIAAVLGSVSRNSQWWNEKIN